MAINQSKWDVDVSQNPPRPMSIILMHGEDVDISVSYYSFGIPLDLSGASATFLFQKISESGETWYSLPMAISGDEFNVASVKFTKAYDDGESDYKFYSQIVLDDSQTFRAYGQIRYLPSPYLAATELPESLYGALRLVGDVADGDMIVLSGDSGELARSGGQPVSVADVSDIVSDAVADGVSDAVSEHDIDTGAHEDIRGLVSGLTLDVSGLSGAIADGVSEHDIDTGAHEDIRGLVSGLSFDLSGLSGAVGNIGSILDAINGEVI